MGVPLGEVGDDSVPHVGEQAVPLCVNVHVTPLFAGSFVTVAVKFCVALTTTLAEFGETETVMAGTVMLVEADLVGSATALAVMVTVKLLAGGPGAV